MNQFVSDSGVICKANKCIFFASPFIYPGRYTSPRPYAGCVTCLAFPLLAFPYERVWRSDIIPELGDCILGPGDSI